LARFLTTSCVHAHVSVSDPSQRISIHEIQDHPWYMKDLPPGVKEMNDNMRMPPAGSQTETEIRGVVQEAQKNSAMNPAGWEVGRPLATICSLLVHHLCHGYGCTCSSIDACLLAVFVQDDYIDDTMDAEIESSFDEWGA
jgi:hypothetical protein